MWRALVFVALLALAAYGAVWLADRPGDVMITYGTYRIQTTVAVALVLTVGTGFLLAVLWGGVGFLLNLPSRWSYATRARRRARGYAAVSRGMVAVGAGDPIAARRHANEAERFLGREPLTLLLKAQAAQVSGNRDAAEAAFQRMMDHDETRVLGLRGLFLEARRRGDQIAARTYAQEAARLAPTVNWANEAVLEAQCAEGNWRGALAIVNRRASLGLLDRTRAKRERAVLLTADALARRDHDEDGALASALDAVKYAPDLVPAAALAGQLLSRRGDLRRAARTVETAWKALPHPDLASVHVNLRPGDSALDRMKRAETLAKLSSWDPEARFALARTALEAGDFEKARHTLEPLLETRPTTRVYLLMADLEQAERGDTGRVREWLARASRAPRDKAWIADGFVSDRWMPTSPVTGRLDAFRWETPPELISDESASLPPIVEDGAREPDRTETPALGAAPEPMAPVPGPETPPAAVIETTGGVPTAGEGARAAAVGEGETHPPNGAARPDSAAGAAQPTTPAIAPARGDLEPVGAPPSGGPPSSTNRAFGS